MGLDSVKSILMLEFRLDVADGLGQQTVTISLYIAFVYGYAIVD